MWDNVPWKYSISSSSRVMRTQRKIECKQTKQCKCEEINYDKEPTRRRQKNEKPNDWANVWQNNIELDIFDVPRVNEKEKKNEKP